MCAYLLLVVGASERERKRERQRDRERVKGSKREIESERENKRERERERERKRTREREKNEKIEREGEGGRDASTSTLPRFPRCVVRRCSSSRRRLETSSRSAIRASERVTSMPRPRRLRLSSASFAVAVSFLPFLSPATSLAAETSAA